MNVSVQAGSSVMKTDLVRISSDIQKHYGFVAVQFLNHAYLNMTKSWICNVDCFDDVLEQTVFITTDQAAYDGLLDWRPELNVRLIEFGTEDPMSYGRVNYYQFGLFRVRMINRLLTSNISILITEGDAVWFKNPLHLFREKPTPSDMHVNVANYADESEFCAGFLYLNATRATQRVWNTLSTRLGKRMSKFKQGQQNIHFRGSEQVILSNIAIREDPIRLTYLSRDRFVSGQWYHSQDMQQNISPVVLQNNYVTGNENKIRRAQKWGHWFLSKNTTQCLPDACQRLNSKLL
ncbi:UDP-galactose:fucoside alpha-3-galactosyltransferase-like [Saccoglossus kowalevskii]